MGTTDAMTLQRCPVCRARLKGDEAVNEPCRRCGSDLTQVRAVYAEARLLQASARQALRAGDTRFALRAAQEAIALVNEESTRATLTATLAAARRRAADSNGAGFGSS